jgi:DNA-binding transcriptional MerR regulator
VLIGALARRTGCSRDTIRFYERMGLVAGTRPAGASNNYRQYDERMVQRIGLIKHAKVLGFTLAEVRGLADAWEADALSRAEKEKIFRDKIALADARIVELRRVKRYLESKLRRLAASPAGGRRERRVRR